MQQNEKKGDDYSFYDLFIPLTTKKAITFISIIGFIIFFNMLFNNFVWDDKSYILFNPDIQTFNLLDLIRNNLFNAGGQYRPIPGIYFASLFGFFKYSTFFYHFPQLIIHIINTSLLFFLFSKFLNKKLSFFLSLIFLIHPIQVESVSYISAADNPLFFLFGLLALHLCLTKTISIRRYSIISLLLLLSLLTKEAGVLFVFIISLYFFLYKRSNFFTLFVSECIALACYLFIRFVIGGVYFSTLPLIPVARLSLSDRLTNVPAIFFYYIKTFFFPFQLAVDQQWIIRAVDFQSFYFPLAIDLLFLLCISFLGIYIYKTKKNFFKLYLFFLSWFICGIALYLQIFPLDGTVADRWFYFPMVGLIGILGIGFQSINFTNKNIKILGYSLIAIILVLLSIRTIIRNANWYDPITLYENDIQISDNFDIENNLGTEYSNIRDYKSAIKHSTKSVELFPYEANIYNLANTYEQIGDIQDAKKYYVKALTYPNYLPINHKHIQITYIRLAYTEYLTNDFKNAEIVCKQGLQEYPNSPYLWIELAASEYRLGDQINALESAGNAKSFLPIAQIASFYSQIENKKPIELKLFFGST